MGRTMNKLVFDKGNCRVVTEDDKHVFYTETLLCEQTIEEIILLWNKGKSFEEVDEFMLNDERCSIEEMEVIGEALYNLILSA
ncbi:MAG TPA: hypothetical protein VN026_12390 [Bacteroidia bacterium]|jgi:hypothetical protein|nr:hypothetical protein [Bacteroidia bacterium]